MKNQWKPLRQYQLQAFTLLETRVSKYPVFFA